LNTIPALEYAPASGRAPANGLLFKPSRRSLLLLFIAALGAIWLARRHAPWHVIAEVPNATILGRGTYFTPGNGLLAGSVKTGLVRADLGTGRITHTFAPIVVGRSFQAIPLKGGSQVAVITDASVASVYDTLTGVAVGQIPNLSGRTAASISDDDTRMITRSVGNVQVWDLTSKLPADQWEPLGTLDTYAATFVCDGTRILYASKDYHVHTLVDAADLRPIATFAHPPDQVLASAHYTGDPGHQMTIQAPSFPTLTTPTEFELRSTRDGALLDAYRHPGRAWVAWSSDRSIRLVGVPTPGRWRETLLLNFVDVGSGRTLKRHAVDADSVHALLIDSRRYLLSRFDGPKRHYDMFDITHRQPIARLELPAGSGNCNFSMSPDGRSLLVTESGRDTSLLLHPTGLDCPESPLGVLAFPQTWLLILSLCGAALSLLADAGRARCTGTPMPPRLLVSVLFAVALILTLRFTIEACRGELLYSPAPVLLVCAIGLATGSRLWRFGTLVGLSAALPVYLHYFWQIRRAGLGAVVGWSLFDRTYDLPQAVLFAVLLVGVGGVVAAIVLLARPRAATW
jgi:hypothetical protein